MARLIVLLTPLTLLLGLGGVIAEESKARADMAALELQTAVEHAGLAARADDVESAREHLQHAINCLAGPQGEGYSEDSLNPCADQGDGAIADYQAAEGADPAIPEVMNQAKALAVVGTEQDRYVGVDAAAHGVSALLEQALHEMVAEPDQEIEVQ